MLTENAGLATLDVHRGPLALPLPVAESSLPIPLGGFSRPGLAVGDADGDGLKDVWTHDICLFLAPLSLPGDVAVGCVDDGLDDNLAYAGLLAFDVDLDGYADAVEGDTEGLRVFRGPLAGDRTVADATWALVRSGTDGYWSAGVAPDRDGDGAAELLLSTSAGAFAVSATPGTWATSDGTVLAGEYGGLPILGGDFDADGSGDIALADPQASWGTLLNAGVTTILWGP